VRVTGLGSIIPARRVVLCTTWTICAAIHATIVSSTPQLPPSSDVSNVIGLVVLTSTRSVERGTPWFMDTEIRFPFDPTLSSAQPHTSFSIKLIHKPITSWLRSTKCSLSLGFFRWKVSHFLHTCYVFKGRPNVIPIRATKACGGSDDIAPLIPNFRCRYRWVFSLKLRPLYPRGKSPRYPLNRRVVGH
jgi:hypothetical protein